MVFLIHLNWQYLIPSSHSHPPILSRGHRRKTEVAADLKTWKHETSHVFSLALRWHIQLIFRLGEMPIFTLKSRACHSKINRNFVLHIICYKVIRINTNTTFLSFHKEPRKMKLTTPDRALIVYLSKRDQHSTHPLHRQSGRWAALHYGALASSCPLTLRKWHELHLMLPEVTIQLMRFSGE